MNKQIYIPKKDEKYVKEIEAAAKKDDPRGGVGAYLVKLHKESKTAASKVS